VKHLYFDEVMRMINNPTKISVQVPRKYGLTTLWRQIAEYEIEVVGHEDKLIVTRELYDVLEEKETPEDIKKHARKPPKDGPCKRCGQNKPLNRLMLCYVCWVKVQLEGRGWREGQNHPSDCGCELECKSELRGFGN